MSVRRARIRRGAYYDSVVLLQLQKSLLDLAGVEEAGVVMATPANLEILAESGLLPAENLDARPDDLLLALRARDEESADAAFAAIDDLLGARRGAGPSGAGEEEDPRPRSLATAWRLLPGANWVMVSVPGRYAAAVARQALRDGRNVFLYSDNVTLDEEVALKREAASRGLLVLGPDCGTAIVNGAGLGFANRVRRGAVGLVAASGTGLQAVASRVHALGEGISHALGTGGRDLSAEVGGQTALAALALLANDEETRVVAILSKPPAPEVATRLLAAARVVNKPVVVHFLGHATPGRRLGNLHFATSLAEAADLCVALARGGWQIDASSTLGASTRPPDLGRVDRVLVRGLFSGGTLAYEALLALRAVLGRVDSNLSHDEIEGDGHRVLDLGADEFTVGRPHPMIDHDFLLQRLGEEAADPRVGVILLDVVLGDGAHADPAANLVPAISAARERARAESREVEFVVLLVGTDDDPQNRSGQREKLGQAGATVVESVEDAVDAAWSLVGFTAPAVSSPATVNLSAPVAVVNVGVELFHDALRAQGVESVQVDWRPPARGDERLAGMLERMRQ